MPFTKESYIENLSYVDEVVDFEDDEKGAVSMH